MKRVSGSLAWVAVGAGAAAVLFEVLAELSWAAFDLAALVLVVLAIVALVWLRPSKRGVGAVPVVQPVVQPRDSGWNVPAQPGGAPAVVNDYRVQPVSASTSSAGERWSDVQPVYDGDLQPLTTTVQPAKNGSQACRRAHVEPRRQPADLAWLDSLPGAAPGTPTADSGNPWPSWDAPRPVPSTGAGADDDEGKAKGALLERRFPRLVDWYLINEVIEGTRSQNAAISELWGVVDPMTGERKNGKDGKTLAWIGIVREFFVQHPAGDRADIIAWELERNGDDCVDVAERLAVPLAEVEAVWYAQ